MDRPGHVVTAPLQSRLGNSVDLLSRDSETAHQVYDRMKMFVSMVIGERLDRPITNRSQVNKLPHVD